MTEEFSGFRFTAVAELKPHRDGSGKVLRLDPRRGDGSGLSHAPFCRFDFPRDWPFAGVYAIKVGSAVAYVGQTNNLSRRFGPGEYGDIRVPDRPDSAQETNRRVNHLILQASDQGEYIGVWFCRTFDRFEIEDTLLRTLIPPWNLAGPGHGRPSGGGGATIMPADFKRVAARAERAKQTLMDDPEAGVEYFERLVSERPADGMVYLKRAEAYEAIGDAWSAAIDFARAEVLLHIDEWKARARAGLRRAKPG